MSFTDRHYVVLPTIDPSTGVSLPLDGTLHDIELHVGDQRTTFPFAVNYSPPSNDSPFKYVVGLAGLIALLASVGFYVYTRRFASASR